MSYLVHLKCREGIFTETAGGVTVAVASKLIRQELLNPEESVVLAISGNGLKTLGAVNGKFEEGEAIQPKLADFEEHYLDLEAAGRAWRRVFSGAAGGSVRERDCCQVTVAISGRRIRWKRNLDLTR